MPHPRRTPAPQLSRPALPALGLLLAAALAQPAAQACPAGGSATPRQAEGDTATVLAWVKAQGRQQVLSFAGYSGAGYQDEPAMLARAAQVLDGQDPAKVAVNIGATAVGIGAVYALARQRGFVTLGIVSSLARDGQVPLSPCVDQVFFVRDSSWGGLLSAAPGQAAALSPTSQALVAVSSSFVAIGGGEVARDELRAAQALGKPVRFYPADMNHALALDKARQRGQPAPTDFRGAAAAALAAPR